MGLVIIPDFPWKVLVLLSFFVTSLYFDSEKCKEFRLPLICLFCFCALNMVSCYILRGQTPYQYFAGNEFISIIGILSFFALPYFGMTLKELEKVLVTLSAVFVFAYLFQYLVYPTSIFVNFKDEELGMGARPRMPGQALLFLCYFYNLNKILIKFEWKHLMMLGFAALDILILGFRSQLFVLFALTIAMITFTSKIKLKKKIAIGVIGLIIAGFFYSIPVVQYKVNQIVERQESGQTFDDENYIRYRTYNYFTEEFPKNEYERYMGTGLPSLSSKYGKHVQKMKQSFIVWADWGLLGLSWMLGIPAVLCLLWYALKAGLLKTEKNYYYLKFWFLFMVFGSILTREMFRIGSFAIQGIVLYMICLSNKRVLKRNPNKIKYGF